MQPSRKRGRMNTPGYCGFMTLSLNVDAMLAQLGRLPPIERAQVAQQLIEEARTAQQLIGRERRNAIAEATAAGASYAEVAAQLGVSTAAINKAITERNAGEK